MRGEPVELIARHQARSETRPTNGLLRDAIQGDPTLFTRDDSVEAAGAGLNRFGCQFRTRRRYEPGELGPDSALKLLKKTTSGTIQKRSIRPHAKPGISD